MEGLKQINQNNIERERGTKSLLPNFRKMLQAALVAGYVIMPHNGAYADENNPENTLEQTSRGESSPAMGLLDFVNRIPQILENTKQDALIGAPAEDIPLLEEMFNNEIERIKVQDEISHLTRDFAWAGDDAEFEKLKEYIKFYDLGDNNTDEERARVRELMENPEGRIEELKSKISEIDQRRDLIISTGVGERYKKRQIERSQNK